MKATETLLLPTGLTLDGKWKSAPIDISCKTNEQLLDLIRGYGLKPKVRNKNSYKKCLEVFSRDQQSWDALRRPPPNMHKGPRRHRHASNLASPLKNPLNAAQHAAHSGRTSLGDPNPVDTREGERILSWALGFSEKDAEAQRQAATGPPAIIPRGLAARGSSALNPSESLSLPSSGDVSLASLVSGLQLVRNATQNLLHVALGGQVPLRPTTDIRGAHDPGSLAEVEAHSEPQHSPDETPVTLAMQGRTVTIPSINIPDPPPLYCRGNIEFINAIWDDNPATWNHSSPLRIDGMSIPLVYWRALYSYRRSKQWSGLKQRWSEYKLLVHEFRSLGKSNFWAKYSANGAAMPMTTILKSLRKARRRVNDATAENARRVFGENFSRIFCYKKHHTTSVIRNDGAIARRYHVLLRDSSDGA